MIKPPFLKNGDTIAIVAPARWIDQELYPSIIQQIEDEGYKVILGKSTYLQHGPFAGTDDERQSDLQEMLDNPEVKAIFCLRGGYGTIRIIDDISFKRFQQNPKWIIGFSDITILHNAIHNLGYASIHGQMPLNFANRSNNKGLEKLFNTLKGESLNYTVPTNSLNKYGEVIGELIGGNIAIFNSLISTYYEVDTTNKILFIEEVGEYLYRFDRLMHHLKMSGKLAGLKGLIVGGLSDMKDNDPAFGQTAEEIIFDMVKEYNYPVSFGFLAGHIKENYPLILGAEVTMLVSETETQINFTHE